MADQQAVRGRAAGGVEESPPPPLPTAGRHPEALRPDDQGAGKGDPGLARPLLPRSEAELSKLKTKLANAGFRSEGAGAVFLGLKLVGLIAALFIGGGTVVTIKGITSSSAM